MKRKNQPKRNSGRILLPGGNSCSNLTIYPANWESSDAPLDIVWRISYRFYSQERSVQKTIKGMNDFRDRKERQAMTRILRDNALANLKGGYNPITKKTIIPDYVDDYVIHPTTGLRQALQKAFDRFQGTPATVQDLKSSLKYLQKSIKNLGYQDRPIRDIEKRHLLNILENCPNIKTNFTANQFNHYRAALIMLYRVLIRYDTVSYCPALQIEVRHHIKKPRRILSQKEREELDKVLKIQNYRLWNFVNLIFYSGCRLAEMVRLQAKHINLERQMATFFVKKGRIWEWIERPIPDEAVRHWQYALAGCEPEHYVFSKKLLPGDKPVHSSATYTRMWQRWVKNPIIEPGKSGPGGHGAKRDKWIDVDMYALKHTHTTEVMDRLEDNHVALAAKINGHTSGRMVQEVYDVKYKSRKDERIKHLGIKFGG